MKCTLNRYNTFGEGKSNASKARHYRDTGTTEVAPVQVFNVSRYSTFHSWEPVQYRDTRYRHLAKVLVSL